jgi:cytochrome c biogenesis protein CcmG/thiol:disulfide interchange protein DsbE
VRRGWRWLVPLAAVPVLTLLAYGFALNPRDVPSPLVGRPAASFALTSFDGARLQLSELRGKVVVVNFWQSDCVPCKQEAKTLDAAARAWSSKGVVFVGVDALDFKGPARAYLRHYGVSYVNVRDASGGTYPGWGVTGTPETFFIDRRGNVVPPHIISVASRERLDEGIRRALSS